MQVTVGQAIWGSWPFPDGVLPEYDRPFLVVEVREFDIGVLTLSTEKNKARQLLLPSNRRLRNYNPPCRFPTFVKLDSLQYIPKIMLDNSFYFYDEGVLDRDELAEILALLPYTG